MFTSLVPVGAALASAAQETEGSGDAGGTTEPTVIVTDATEGCRDGGGVVCDWVYDVTGSETLADWTTFLLDKPLKILLIVVVAAVLNRLARRAIRQMTDRVAAAAETDSPRKDLLVGTKTSERAAQRAETIKTVLKSVATMVIWTLAALLILGELGVNLGPLVAGAGIAGVALGFGAQSLVKDFLTGFFMLLEDQFGVGDTVDIGEAQGTVEKVTLRTTTLRDVYGTLWHVPNGEIVRVGNKSQLWAMALVDIGVAYETDLAEASRLIEETAVAMSQDPDWSGRIEERPQVLGVQDLAADAVVVRLTAKVVPAAQFAVERELRARIKAGLDEAGIEIPFPQRTVWLRQEEPVATV